MRELIERLGLRPATCTWELTLRCDLACRHCGSRAGAPRAAELDRVTALRVVGELAAAGCERLTLSGGEPTLSPDWEAVTEEGARLGVPVNMVVNGAAHDRAFVRRARSAGLRGLGVSLDGLEEEHDALRGRRGLFGRVMDLLDDCAAEGLPAAAITTVWRGNARSLEAIAEVLAGRVYAWQVQLGEAMGNLCRGDQIDPEDLLDLVPRLAALVGEGRVPLQVADNVGYYGPHEETLRRVRARSLPCWTGCYGGCRHVGIEADGGVKACLSLQASDATEGNVARESFLDLWRRPGAFAANRAWRPESLGGFCRTCEHAAVCRGGCLSMRTCEGGENRFCYHRVATLAEERRAGGRARAPRRAGTSGARAAWAPAALLALVGLGGCPGAEDLYGMPPQPDAGPADARPLVVDAYGVPLDVLEVRDAYGIPLDAEPGDAGPEDGAPKDGAEPDGPSTPPPP